MTPPVGPPIPSKELLEWLERQYPSRMPSPDETDRALWMRTGQVALVQDLRSRFNRAHSPTHVTGG